MSTSAEEPLRLTATELHRQTGSALREVRRGREVEIIDRYGDRVAELVPPRQEQEVAASA